MVEFNSLDLQAEIEISQRNLPHGFQVGAAMFVTFRTIDSLPRDVVLRMRRELQKWLACSVGSDSQWKKVQNSNFESWEKQLRKSGLSLGTQRYGYSQSTEAAGTGFGAMQFDGHTESIKVQYRESTRREVTIGAALQKVGF